MTAANTHLSSQTTRNSSAAWAIDIKELRQIRDDFITTQRQGRERWYNEQLQKINWRKEEPQVDKFARCALNSIHRSLTNAAANGGSKIEYSVLNPIEALGWRYSSYSEDGQLMQHSVFDISMNVSLHQTRIRAAKIIADAILRSGASCTTVRNPIDGPDCFVEQLLLKIEI